MLILEKKGSGGLDGMAWKLNVLYTFFLTAFFPANSFHSFSHSSCLEKRSKQRRGGNWIKLKNFIKNLDQARYSAREKVASTEAFLLNHSLSISGPRTRCCEQRLWGEDEMLNRKKLLEINFISVYLNVSVDSDGRGWLSGWVLKWLEAVWASRARLRRWLDRVDTSSDKRGRCRDWWQFERNDVYIKRLEKHKSPEIL